MEEGQEKGVEEGQEEGVEEGQDHTITPLRPHGHTPPAPHTCSRLAFIPLGGSMTSLREDCRMMSG